MTTTKNTEEFDLNVQTSSSSIINENETEHSSNEYITESTLFAEPIYHIGSFNITNSLFTSWVVVFILIVITILIRLKLKQIPRGIQNFFELVVEGAESLCDQVTNNRKITNKAFPIVFTIFLIVLLNNWMGILPFGGFGIIEMTEHGKLFIPLIRSGTADINGTLPLAIMSVVGANLFGIISRPEVESDVFIDRGTISVMDYHLKLSEIKNLGQLTRYGNGFYKINKQ
jgi:F0F1-type ATP synthase membrane subunit a